MIFRLSFLLNFSTFICFRAKSLLLYLLILFLSYGNKKSSSEQIDSHKKLKFKALWYSPPLVWKYLFWRNRNLSHMYYFYFKIRKNIFDFHLVKKNIYFSIPMHIWSRKLKKIYLKVAITIRKKPFNHLRT